MLNKNLPLGLTSLGLFSIAFSAGIRRISDHKVELPSAPENESYLAQTSATSERGAGGGRQRDSTALDAAAAARAARALSWTAEWT